MCVLGRSSTTIPSVSLFCSLSVGFSCKICMKFIKSIINYNILDKNIGELGNFIYELLHSN